MSKLSIGNISFLRYIDAMTYIMLSESLCCFLISVLLKNIALAFTKLHLIGLARRYLLQVIWR